jgi:hypothetical protein
MSLQSCPTSSVPSISWRITVSGHQAFDRKPGNGEFPPMPR